MTIPSIHELFLGCSSISTDTRKIVPGSMFVAIRGDRFDANTFAAEALSKGASYVIIDNEEFYIDDRTILVDDGLTSLQQLSSFHRQYLGLPIIALTGSNGKTTTKELINAVLSMKYRTGATVGNLNNHIGVPLTLLSFTKDTEIGIVEMGANHQKEIEFLCGIAQPDFGYITNFGKAHLEGFGGVEGVIKGKGEMYAFLRENNKTAFVNLDDPIQEKKSAGIERFTFGLNSGADVMINEVMANPFVTVSFDGKKVNSKLIGLYNSNNINAAIAIGKYFKVDDSAIKSAIENYIPENNRSQMLQKNGNDIILDAYNANPSSMAAAIENFKQLDKSRKIAILGDMFELGNESLQEHKNVIGLADDPATNFIFVGHDFFTNKNDDANKMFFDTFEALSDYLKSVSFSGNTILIKGSRGMALERVLEWI